MWRQSIRLHFGDDGKVGQKQKQGQKGRTEVTNKPTKQASMGVLLPCPVPCSDCRFSIPRVGTGQCSAGFKDGFKDGRAPNKPKLVTQGIYPAAKHLSPPQALNSHK